MIMMECPWYQDFVKFNSRDFVYSNSDLCQKTNCCTSEPGRSTEDSKFGQMDISVSEILTIIRAQIHIFDISPMCYGYLIDDVDC